VWRVTGVRAVVGEGFTGVVRFGVSQAEVLPGKVSAGAAGVGGMGGWRIAGLTRNRRYVE